MASLKLEFFYCDHHSSKCNLRRSLIQIKAMDEFSGGFSSVDDWEWDDSEVFSRVDSYILSSCGDDRETEVLVNPTGDVDLPITNEYYVSSEGALALGVHGGLSDYFGTFLLDPVSQPFITSTVLALIAGKKPCYLFFVEVIGAVVAATLAFTAIGLIGDFLGFVNKRNHGSLALGGALDTMAARTKMFFPLFISSGIFVIEVLLVIAQVFYLKTTKHLYGVGRRLFQMTPLHPHFEYLGCFRNKRNKINPRQSHDHISVSSSRVSCASSSVTFESSSTLMAEDKFDSQSASLLVKELRGSFTSGRTKSYEWRVSQLKGIEKMVVENEKYILDALAKDLSKPQLESFVAEVSMTKNACNLALKELKHWMKPQKVKTQITTFPSSAEIVSEPLGVVLVISAWNYPFLLSLDPVIGAIASGNAVVLKPSEISPATSSLLAKFVAEYLDSSAIRVVEGAVSETSALLEQKWDKIFYTGNGRVGRIVMAAAAKHLTPVVLELGGKSPVVVDSNINLKVAARRIVYGKWACNNGQACIAPDYIITTKAFAPTLVDELQTILEEFYGKDPMESNDLSRVVNSNHFARLTKLLDEDKVSGKIVCGGQRDESRLKIAPTILLDVPQDSLIMQEEIFGPLLPIITVDNMEECFDVIQSRSKPLAAYLFTNDKNLEKKFVSNISSGGMVVNDTVIHLTLHTLPFGGVGESGMGSYHGKFSFHAFSHQKAVLYRGFAGDASARYPPFTPKKKSLLLALLKGDIIGAILALLGWNRKQD